MIPNGPYNPKENEAEMLKFWLENKFYKPEYDPKKDSVVSTEEMKADVREAWALICPPPNAYARPHIGNISGYAYQDAMARYQRMKGKKVLVLPGKDHAGLEGEGVFVREVLDKNGRNKFDMKREDFYKEIMEFNMVNKEKALKDEREIGLSADFDRDTFTLDPDIVEIVLDTFVEMYKDGRIYKGVRIVNWDPKARTAVADNQIEYEEATTPFVYFKYGFIEPEEKAIEIKNIYSKLESVEFTFERNKTRDGENDLPFSFGYVDGIDTIAIGFSKELTKDQKLTGNPIGIQMRIDKKFRLVIVSPEFGGDIHEEIDKIFLFENNYYGGAHIILFEEYKEDKFYNNGFILGTVRPETKFGDTAIAFNPKDERYKKFEGKAIKVRTVNGETTLNIISDYAVESEFGTGLVKITPAHSQVDWEIAGRHPKECLPAKQVIGYDLKLNHLTGKYSGMNIKQARAEIMEDMKREGMLIMVDENYQNRIQIAERTKAPIEPLLSSQWYLKYDGIKEAAMQMVINAEKSRGEKVEDVVENPDEIPPVQIHPENMEAKFMHWMNNLRDWAISRSLWWGYRLPVWYNGKIEERIGEDGQVKEYISLKSKVQSSKLEEDQWVELDYKNPNHLRVQKESPGKGWIQDDNVLDTWFSSGQWVYATLTKHGLMDTFFPSSTLVSAHDILENWDSRMMMFTYFKHKTIPFHNLFLTGLVLGTDGQKMSKSKGNMIDIDKVKDQYGTDSVRMAYFYQNSAGGSYVINDEKLKNFKNFNNKIWNATRFTLMNLEGLSDTNVYSLKKEDLKIESNIKLFEHIEEVKQRVTTNMEKFQFGNATSNLYDEFWHSFCDIHLEEAKPHVYTFRDKETGEIKSEPKPEEKLETQKVLLLALKTYLKMLHPFIPFITERIWQEIPKEEGDHKSLMYSRW